MYAVIEAGGKQHRVAEGETLKLEKIEAATGETIEFDRVLMVGAGEERAGIATGALVGARKGSHPRLLFGPLVERKDEEAPLLTLGDDTAFLDGVAELPGQHEPPLLIHAVLVFTE